MRGPRECADANIATTPVSTSVMQNSFERRTYWPRKQAAPSWLRKMQLYPLHATSDQAAALRAAICDTSQGRHTKARVNEVHRRRQKKDSRSLANDANSKSTVLGGELARSPPQRAFIRNCMRDCHVSLEMQSIKTGVLCMRRHCKSGHCSHLGFGITPLRCPGGQGGRPLHWPSKPPLWRALGARCRDRAHMTSWTCEL